MNLWRSGIALIASVVIAAGFVIAVTHLLVTHATT